MIDAPLAIGATSWLGGWGLRQTLPIVEVPDPFPRVSIPSRAMFISPSGELIADLIAGRGAGEKLTMKWREAKFGGLQDFEITVKKETPIPFFSGLEVRMMIAGRAWATGEVRAWPSTDTRQEAITITGIGYCEKLKNEPFTGTFAEKTADEILEDMIPYITAQGIAYNRVKVAAPSVFVDALEFGDKTAWDVVQRLAEILNFRYADFQFVFGVDAEREFYFYGTPRENAVAHVFEGFDYQDPDVEVATDDMVNRVRVYRTREGDEGVTEFVAEYTDPDSVDEFFLSERKITISDFISADVAANIAAAILAEKKDPRKRITAKKMTPAAHMSWGFYGVSNKRSDQRIRLSNFELLGEWSATLTASVLATQEKRAYTGRRCFSWTTNGATGDRIALDFDRTFSPRLARISLRSALASVDMRITFYGETSRRIRTIGLSTGDHLGESGGEILSALDVGDGYVSALLDRRLANDWIETEIDLSAMLYVERVEIEIANAAADTVLLDWLEIETFSYFYNRLSLEAVTYTVGDFSVTAEAEFGNRMRSLVSELESLDEKNNVTYDIFSKESP